MQEINTEIESSVAVSSHETVKKDLFSADVTLVLLTWITFLFLLAILYKFAWKPILAGLDKREETIRKSLEEADRIKEELREINQKREQLIREAEDKSKEIIDQGRKAAIEAAHIIEHKAKEESQIMLENAERQIKDVAEEAQFELRKMSADIAVELAGRLIEENLDSEKNRKLVNELIKHV